MCCEVEVSVTSWSLVQRSPTDCDASCVIKKPQKWGGHGPRWAAAPQKTNKAKQTVSHYLLALYLLVTVERLWWHVVFSVLRTTVVFKAATENKTLVPCTCDGLLIKFKNKADLVRVTQADATAPFYLQNFLNLLGLRWRRMDDNLHVLDAVSPSEDAQYTLCWRTGGAQIRPASFGEEIYKYFELTGGKNTISQTSSPLTL
jgi:hypothetical protein